MRNCKFLIAAVVTLALLPVIASAQVLQSKKSSPRPIIKWAPIKKAANYKVSLIELNSTSGEVVSKTSTLVSTPMWQPDSDLTGSLYRVKVKAVKKKSDPLLMYISPDDRYVNVPAEDLLLASNFTNTYNNFNYAEASVLSGTNGLVVIADVVLPEGSKLKDIVVFYNGGSSSKNIQMFFYKVPFQTTDLTNDTVELVSFNILTQGDTATLRSHSEDVSSSNIIIDNENMRYQILSVLQNTDGISSVRFYYEGEEL